MKKLGRIRPKAPTPRLRLSNYLPKIQVQPPPTCDYSQAARPSLTNIFGNDALGDCVIAAGMHIVGVETGGAGDLFVPTSDQVIAQYSAIGGYVPGDPTTDQGCDPSVAINYWQSSGFPNGTKLTGAIAIDPSNPDEVRLALYLFENLFLGFEVPDAWISPFPSADGFEWDVAGDPDPNNGHQVMACGYGPGGVTIDTWALLGTLTWAALAKYCALSANGDLFALLTPDQISAAIGKAPNGLAWADLVGDFDALGGQVPPAPAPTPPAPQPPTPSGPSLTLDQAIAALTAGWPS